MDKVNVKSKIVVTLSADKNQWEDLYKKVEDNELFIDIIEYRADLCGGEETSDYLEDLQTLKEKFSNLPIIFTYRTHGQGGKGELEPNEYYALNRSIIEAGGIDIIDIELFLYEDLRNELIELAHDKGIQVLVSHHEMDHTPSLKEMKALYQHMQQLNVDYSKLAVMPEDGRDVLKLLTAVYETKQDSDHHIVGIAMGEQGKLSRLAGGAFGSALTYGHIGQEAAPGQLHVQQLKALMEIYQ
ncbi:type I 3-dehydroquinate dehydratase [Macrococcus brunensis]|nr:type I 3-dehydroquinate dehydratase [Macrococcus brunensis]ULG74823.1 type I 3-dehydroquinate dehydratase [Macrococcus brunensis]